MIKIEVTGNSIAEVADKLMAIGASLLSGKTRDGSKTTLMGAMTALSATMPELAEEVVYVPDVAVGPAPEVAEAAPAREPAPSVAAAEPTTTAVTPTPAPAVTEGTLRELVLGVVAAKGRDAMVELLGRFGVAKATDVPAEQQEELVGALKDALA